MLQAKKASEPEPPDEKSKEKTGTTGGPPDHSRSAANTPVAMNIDEHVATAKREAEVASQMEFEVFAKHLLTLGPQEQAKYYEEHAPWKKARR